MSLQHLFPPRFGRAGLAGLLALTLVAGACGGDDDDDASAEATTSTAAGAVTTAGSDPYGGGEATTTSAEAATSGASVEVQGFSFKPASLSVKAGTEVTWTNKDQIQHTVTSGTSTDDGSGTFTGAPDGKFNGDMPEQGKTFSFTFSTPGTYKYFCSRHNSMVGEVVVT